SVIEATLDDSGYSLWIALVPRLPYVRPEVWRMRSWTVISRATGTVMTVVCPVAGSVRSTPICMLLNAGRYFDTGSEMRRRPSSLSDNAATVTIGFVIDAMRKIASFVIGALAALSRKPTAWKYATRPLRATTTTAPEMRPRSTSARRDWAMR